MAKKVTKDLEQEYRQEAERLAFLPRADQLAIIALHASVAQNSKVPKKDREASRHRAKALTRHLRKLSRKTENPS